MHQRLAFRFQQLEDTRRNLQDRIASLSPEEFHRCLGDKWSIAQITAHLVHAERLSIKYIRKKKPGIAAFHNTGPWESFKIILFRISQRLPFRFKAPAVVILSTPTYEAPQTLFNDWGLVRAELKALLEEFQDDEIRKKIYRHVAVGMLNVEQSLVFFQEHFIHHMPQIHRQL